MVQGRSRRCSLLSRRSAARGAGNYVRYAHCSVLMSDLFQERLTLDGAWRATLAGAVL
jgi:hypothetical protein